MESFEYGPVEIFIVEFEGSGIDPGVLDSVLAATASGAVRLLDMAVAARAADGTVSYTEVVGTEDGTGAEGVTLEVQGLLGEDDLAEAVASIAPGHGVALVALELCWATDLAQSLTAARGQVVRSERIPAAAVNQLTNEQTVLEA